MKPGLLTLGLLLFCLGNAAVARAQRTERVTAPFWRAVRDPEAARSRVLLKEAASQLKRAARLLPTSWETICRRIITLPLSADNQQVRAGRLRALLELLPHAQQRLEYLERAVRLLQEAARLAPEDPETLYALARAQAAWERPAEATVAEPGSRCLVERRNDQAVETLQRLRRVDPDYRADRVAFELGILHTRNRRYREASAEYRRAIALSLDRRDTAITYANLGEVTMLAGDLEGAVESYRRSLAASVDDGQPLALWGLAVSLDRLGEHETALQTAGRALRASGGGLQILRSDGVFFEPEYEVHYYEALGHEAISRRPDAIRENALSAAERSWRLFLQRAAPSCRWSSRAAANLARIQSELASVRREKQKRPSGKKTKR
jgi:tetratricopeptide (TPR) repeat protein